MSDSMIHDWPEDFRAGFISIVGRPNAGKSTLTNALVGQKIVITANQPETTRRIVRGIVHRETGQLVLVDTPGLHRPRTLLGERLNDMVRDSLDGVDGALMCLPADEKIGPGDRFLLGELAQARIPIFAAVTKVDKISRQALADKLFDVSQLYDFVEIIPVSAVSGDQVELVADVLLKHMPLSPPLYPVDTVTDESDEAMIGEFIREAALTDVREELPHSIAVVVEEMIEREAKPGAKKPPLLDIHAHIYVERPSQKGIIIGHGGQRLRKVGQEARKNIEQLLGRKIFLDLHVKVAKDWQRDPKKLGRLGF